jgi:hypothetical protein
MDKDKMKYNSIEGIDRWYNNTEGWESWDIVVERARREWREEIQQAYKSGVEQGMVNVKNLIEGMDRSVEKLKGDVITPMSNEEWFKNNWG